MSEYSVLLTTTKTFRNGYLKEIEVTNTGTETLTVFTLDISTSANLLKAWGGSYEALGGGAYRLSIADLSIPPGETATLTLKASGPDEIAVLPPPDPGPIMVGPDITAAELQALIDAAEPGDEIQLQAGNYYFDRTIVIDRDGVSVTGAGSDLTLIHVAGLGKEAFAVGEPLTIWA